MNNAVARRILSQAISEDRCGEFMDCLFDGGSATVDATTGRLVLVSASVLSAMAGEHDDDVAGALTMSERACILTGCDQPGAEEVGGHLLCVDHANEARQIMVKTVFGKGLRLMAALDVRDLPDGERDRVVEHVWGNQGDGGAGAGGKSDG